MISQSIEKEELILSAALELFAENGFHGTPTSAIAKRAGVANGTLFHYFKTKEDLINALYLKLKNEMVGAMTDGLNLKNSLKQRFELIWLKGVEWNVSQPRKFNFMQQFMYSPYLSASTHTDADKLAGIFLDLFEEGIKSGAIKSLPLELLYATSSQQLFGLVQYLIAHTEKQKDSDFILGVYELYWAAIKA